MRAEKDPIYCGILPLGRDQAVSRSESPSSTPATRRGSRSPSPRARTSATSGRSSRANGLERHFGVIVGKDNIKRYKPHPDTYLVAAEKLGIRPGTMPRDRGRGKGREEREGGGNARDSHRNGASRGIWSSAARISRSRASRSSRDLLEGIDGARKALSALLEEALDRSPARRLALRSRTSPQTVSTEAHSTNELRVMRSPASRVRENAL